MARTSKTRLGSSGEMNDRMMRAAESGNRMVSQERDRIDTLRREGQQNMQRFGQGVASAFQEQARLDQQQGQFERQMADQEARTDLEGAKAGFERSPGPGGDRAAKLEAEMARGAQQTSGGIGAIGEQEQQNLQGQGKKPLEMDGGTWRPSEQGEQMQKRKNFEADTQRIRAEAYRDQVAASVQKAKMQGNAEEAKKLQGTLSAPVNAMGEFYDRFMNDKATEGDWRNLAEMAKGIEGFDPTIAEDIKRREWSPRLQSMLRANQSYEALKYIVRTGDTSDLKNVDWTSPQMQQFTQNVAHFNALAKSLGPAFSKFAGINSISDKMAFLNTQAAMSIITGMDTAQDPTGGAPPSPNLPEEDGQAPPQMPQDPNAVGAQNAAGTSDPYATDEMTQRAIEARRRGEHVPPADSPEFRQQFGNRKPTERPSSMQLKRSGL